MVCDCPLLWNAQDSTPNDDALSFTSYAQMHVFWSKSLQISPHIQQLFPGRHQDFPSDSPSSIFGEVLPIASKEFPDQQSSKGPYIASFRWFHLSESKKTNN